MKRNIFLIPGLILLCASCRSHVDGIDNNPIDTSYGNSQILIAYFLYSGNTQTVANMINEEIDADIFRIVPAKAYTNDDVFDRAQAELKNKEYPELSAHIDKELFAK